jgi:hypothetical protein
MFVAAIFLAEVDQKTSLLMEECQRDAMGLHPIA